MTRLPILSLLLLAGVLPPATSAGAAPALGRIDFPNSGAEEAQGPFIRGVLLLHSFEYEDAREAFLEAQRVDPGFALAYWGEAMTHNHPLWRQQDSSAARAALERLAPTAEERLAKAPTDRERGYVEALEALYGDGNKIARDQAYSEAMRDLSERFPDDLEASSFYALSILGTAQGVRDFRTYMRAAAVVEEVFARNPEHPGAAHYLIHSYDDPVHAPLGLRAARVYARIAPDASHAQHMISHIFVALGRWEDSVESNIKAFEVSRARAERKGSGVDSLNYHALHWLEYSYLQLGRFDEAGETVSMMRDFAVDSRSPRALAYYAAMRAAWVVETKASSPPETVGAESMPFGAATLDRFATGYGALIAGDAPAARQILAEMAAARAAATTTSEDERRDAFADVSQETIEEARVLEELLQSRLALDEGRSPEALQLLQRATAVEASRPLEYGPPSIVKPSHELHGEVLLRLARPRDAAERFEQALERAPRRRLSLEGLASAAAAIGDRAALERACDELTALLSRPDPRVALPAACPPTASVASVP